MDDRQNILRPVLDSHPNGGFKSLTTVWIAVFEAFLLVSLQIGTFAVVFIWPDEQMDCDIFYTVAYAHVCLWVIYFLMNHCLKWYHLRLRKEGYLEFYDTLNKIASLPFYAASIWNAVLLVTLTMYSEMATSPRYFCNKSKFTSPANFIAFLITVENLILLPVFTYYIMLVRDFNKGQRLPDAEQDNRWMPNILRESISSGEVGYRERCEAVDNMLEKQADLIRYYKEANDHLNKKVLELSAQLRTTAANA